MKVVTLVVEIDEDKAKWLKEGKMKHGISLIEKYDGDAMEVLRDLREETELLLVEMDEFGITTMTHKESMELIQEDEGQEVIEGLSLLKRPRNDIPRC